MALIGSLRRGRRLAAGLLLLALLGAFDALVVEPRWLLVGDRVRLDLGDPGDVRSRSGAPLRLLHLSDLHVAGETPVLAKLVRQAAALKPDAIVVSGDLVQDVKDAAAMARHTRETARVVGELARIAPTYAVQGHSDYDGAYVAALSRAGLVWLGNEGRRIGPGGSYLLLGIDQQVGADRHEPQRAPFGPRERGGEWLYAAPDPGGKRRNFYSHWDPAPAGLADGSGPLAWSGYDATVEVLLDGWRTSAGMVVHSRYPRGEDRMIRLRYASPGEGPGTFVLVPHGTDFTGARPADTRLDTGVTPEARRWYRLRLSTRVEPDVVRVGAKVWPAGEPEPARFQAWAEDRSPWRVEAGTAGLWTFSTGSGGTAFFRNLRVVDDSGAVLLDVPLASREEPAGFRQGARGTRLEMALARSPEVPSGTPAILLTHSPDAVRDAVDHGLDLVLAGHTHGGQVRLPFHGAITTRTRLGPHYSRGLYEFAAPNPRGWTWLSINQGMGTSMLPIRFWCPPTWTLVELGPTPPPRAPP